jgi:replicative DNA helicase
VQDEAGYYKKRLVARIYDSEVVARRDWSGLAQALGRSDDREEWLRACGSVLWLTEPRGRGAEWQRLLGGLRSTDPCAGLIQLALEPERSEERAEATACRLLEQGLGLGTKLRWLLVERVLGGADDADARAGLSALRHDLLSELEARGLPASEIPAWVHELADGDAEALSRWIEREESLIREGLTERVDRGDLGVRVHVTDALTQLMDRERGEGRYGLCTGFADLDEHLGGLQGGELIVFAARPSMGKSSLVLNILANTVLYQGHSATHFSTESTATAVTERMICALGKVDGYRVRGGFLNKAEKRNYLNACEMLEPAPLYLYDSAESLEDLVADCRRQHARNALSLIVVDQPSGFVERLPDQSLSVIRPEDAALALRNLAQELGVPVVVTASLSRRAERKSGPRLADLKPEALEVLADKVVLLHRPEYYEPDREEFRGIARICVAKNKDGQLGEFELLFVRNQMRFASLCRY